MDDPVSFRSNVVRPVLQRLALWSPVAENLLVGTALQESLLTYTQQLGGGPALGYFQMEPATHDDCWKNFLKYRAVLASKVRTFLQNDDSTSIPDAKIMIDNPYYAAAMCRVRYYRVPTALPSDPNDIMSLANYWKQWYNTPLGAGKPQEYYDKYVKYAQ
jgi:hypothetical protein